MIARRKEKILKAVYVGIGPETGIIVEEEEAYD